MARYGKFSVHSYRCIFHIMDFVGSDVVRLGCPVQTGAVVDVMKNPKHEKLPVRNTYGRLGRYLAGILLVLTVLFVLAIIVYSRQANPQQVFYQATEVAGNTAVVENLLRQGGIDLNWAPDDVCGTALYSAALRGDLSMVKVLVAHGANMAIGKRHLPPVVAAAASNHIEVLNFLLDQGAAWRWRVDNREETVLEYAVAADRRQVVLALLRRGIDPNIGSSVDGSTALRIALHKKEMDIANDLRAYGARETPSATTPFENIVPSKKGPEQ